MSPAVGALDSLIEEVKSRPEKITTIPYTEFLAVINQANVPPGAYTTINEWGVHGNVTDTSNILELASTTGFSLRELSARFGAKGLGTDVCNQSVERANCNTKAASLDSKISYQAWDALDANSLLRKDVFTHVVIGASLRFIDNLQKTPFIETLFEGIDHRVVLLTCEFFVEQTVPEELLVEAEGVFGIRPTVAGYKTVTRPYGGLTKLYEAERKLRPETDKELKHYCESTIERFCNQYSVDPTGKLASRAYARLHKIKDISNRLRLYQSYVVLVHEYNSLQFGKRYTELF